MYIKSLNNNRGASLIGVMVAAVIGLVVVLGLSKSLINFAEQTAQTSHKQSVSQAGINLATVLRSNKMWNDSVRKMGGSCKFPGQKPGCNFELQRNGKRITCNDGSYSDAVGFLATSGALVEDLNCSKCDNDKMCGLDPNKHIRFKISFKNIPDPNRPFELPDFVAKTEDIGGSKHVTSVDITNDDGILIDPTIFKCPDGEYIAGVNNDGTPVCKTLASELGNLNCPNGQYLAGVNPDLTPKCRSVIAALTVNNCRAGTFMTGITGGNPRCQNAPTSTNTVTRVVQAAPRPAPRPAAPAYTPPADTRPSSFSASCRPYPTTHKTCGVAGCGGGSWQHKCPSTWRCSGWSGCSKYFNMWGCLSPYKSQSLGAYSARCVKYQ